jgi:uncharacterized membrane protein YtjA (UPF0391 family)
MLKWTAIFFAIAIVAAISGYTALALGTEEIAKVVFLVFAILGVLVLVLCPLIFRKKGER